MAAESQVFFLCRLGHNQKPLTKPTRQRNIKHVKAETWESVNQMLVRKAQELGIELGDRTRTDCTVVESNIHHPTDSSRLWDCARVLTRLMGWDSDFGPGPVRPRTADFLATCGRTRWCFYIEVVEACTWDVCNAACY
jgi:hypothetical protein